MLISFNKINTEARKEEKRQEQEWARIIKERDNWSCVICGSQYKPNAHHIIPREFKCFKYDLDNGITLCTKHHKFCRFISAHNAPFAFYLWLKRYKPFLLDILENRIRGELLKEGIKV